MAFTSGWEDNNCDRLCESVPEAKEVMSEASSGMSGRKRLFNMASGAVGTF